MLTGATPVAFFGLANWIDYYHKVAQLPIVPEELTGDDLVEAYANLDVAVIGTPDDAIATIEKLQKQTGGFGCFMLLAHEWANRRATEESYELFARFVMPHFQGSNDNREASRDWVIASIHTSPEVGWKRPMRWRTGLC